MADKDVLFCQHAVTEFITKEDNYTTGTVNQFQSSSAATRTSPVWQCLTKNCQQAMQQAENCCSTWNWTQWHADDTNFWTPVSLLGSCFPHVNRQGIQKGTNLCSFTAS
jgi:hypothetical protein